MAFEFEHDWQASLATPKPSIGESAKTNLLLLLCFIWLVAGLIGHHPWKPDEATTVGAVKHLLAGGSWVVPSVAGEITLEYPPLYYLSAALSAKLASLWLPLHDGARLITGFWMALTLLMVGMSGREMWGRGAGRQTTLIFISSIGLFFSGHQMSPEVAALTGYAAAFYGIALARRRPWRAAPLVGGGIAIAFLSSGVIAAAIILITALLLPILFRNWRIKPYFVSLSIGLLFAVPWIAAWLIALSQHSPDLFHVWLLSERHAFSSSNILYFGQLLLWFSWPALPLAIWSLWHFRKHLLQRPQFQLSLVFFIVTLILLGLNAEGRDPLALPLLLPLAIMGGAAIDKLWRGMASALDWFGIMLFGFIGFLVWLGWFAMMTGMPARLATRMHVLSEAYVPHFDWIAFSMAIVITLIWAVMVFHSKRSNRAAITDWALGITMVWGLLMALWLPWLDASKSYGSVFTDMQKALPQQFGCMATRNVGSFQSAMLHYYTDITPQRFEKVQHMGCDLLLIQDERRREKIAPGPDWELIWKGKRPSDRHESFRLYQLKENS
ncbi:MAG: glycosyl transferase [Methylobacillus sp.]|jgi:4-amino-4-deoxy-L-arabinose transferase-like glycosyltransferase|nr:glycosyl transferase [Methylobacillus sp.]